jgi:hypothetical protein
LVLHRELLRTLIIFKSLIHHSTAYRLGPAIEAYSSSSYSVMADTAPATEGAVDPQISTNGTLEPLAQTDVEMKDEPAIDVCFSPPHWP